MKSGIEYTKMVKYMLKEANQSAKNLYMQGLPYGPENKISNPTRIIGVQTVNGLTIARTINGGTLPVSDLNFNRLYIQ